MAIHPVRHSTMARDTIAEVLDVECTLQTRCEEATERCDQTCKSRKHHYVELNWLDGYRAREEAL